MHPGHDDELQVRPSWPFPGDQFPDDLGAVVHNSILEGRRPALQVVHFASGDWGIADGVDWPDVGNLSLTHIAHVVADDPSIAELASLPPGQKADREEVGGPWVFTPHTEVPRGTETLWKLMRPVRWLVRRVGSRDIRRH